MVSIVLVLIGEIEKLSEPKESLVGIKTNTVKINKNFLNLINYTPNSLFSLILSVFGPILSATL